MNDKGAPKHVPIKLQGAMTLGELIRGRPAVLGSDRSVGWSYCEEGCGVVRSLQIKVVAAVWRCRAEKPTNPYGCKPCSWTSKPLEWLKRSCFFLLIHCSFCPDLLEVDFLTWILYSVRLIKSLNNMELSDPIFHPSGWIVNRSEYWKNICDSRGSWRSWRGWFPLEVSWQSCCSPNLQLT